MNNVNRSSRTKNTSRNIIVGLICKVILILFPFVNRTVLIYTLGTEYVGLGSLFSSILTVLNIAELGFNAAIIYNMYEPLAKNDQNRIRELLALYRYIYRIIGSVIFIFGIILMPFIPKLINGKIPTDINIYILFFLYLLNSALSYLMFAYKESVLLADQRQDLSDVTRTIVLIVEYVIQIIVLLIFHNYYLYVVCAIVGTIITNIMLAVVVNKRYPQYKKVSSSKAEITLDMKRQMGALLINRICSVTRNSIDSIVISAFLGLTMVTIYNNYYCIFNALYTVVLVLSHSMTASIGNSLVTESLEKNYHDLKRFSFLHVWISGWMSICMLCIYQPFMRIWMGENLLLSNKDMVLFCVYFFAINLCNVKNQYVTASGTQTYYKNGYVVQMILNIVLNICLGKYWGVTGIIIATIITTLGIDVIYMTLILFKTYFKNGKVMEYLKLNLKWTLEILAVGVITFVLCNLFRAGNLQQLLINAVICIIVPNILFLIIWKKTTLFQEAKMVIINIFKLKIKQ